MEREGHAQKIPCSQNTLNVAILGGMEVHVKPR